MQRSNIKQLICFSPTVFPFYKLGCNCACLFPKTPDTCLFYFLNYLWSDILTMSFNGKPSCISKTRHDQGHVSRGHWMDDQGHVSRGPWMDDQGHVLSREV